jgi:hypothetical protein
VADQGVDLAELSGGRFPSDPSEVISNHWEAARRFAESLETSGGAGINLADLRCRGHVKVPAGGHGH